MAWKLWKSEARMTSSKYWNIERPAPVFGSSQRVCQPPQPSETLAFGACWWNTASASR